MVVLASLFKCLRVCFDEIGVNGVFDLAIQPEPEAVPEVACSLVLAFKCVSETD